MTARLTFVRDDGDLIAVVLDRVGSPADLHELEEGLRESLPEYVAGIVVSGEADVRVVQTPESEQDKHAALARAAEAVKLAPGTAVEIAGVRMVACDTYGRPLCWCGVAHEDKTVHLQQVREPFTPPESAVAEPRHQHKHFMGACPVENCRWNRFRV